MWGQTDCSVGKMVGINGTHFEKKNKNLLLSVPCVDVDLVAPHQGQMD